MALELKKIKDDAYKIKIPKKTAFTIDTPQDQLKLHQLCCLSAQRGCGKGVILSSLLQGLKKQNCMDRIIILSPTIDSNRPIFEPLEIDVDDEYHTADADSIKDIIRKCDEEMDEWEEYLEQMETYKALQKMIKNQKIDIHEIDPDILLKALEGGYLTEPPKSKYGHKPILGLIVDDFQGSNLYNTNPKNPFINLCLRHRHVARGLGISIFMCVQTYGGAGGVPRVIRQNITSLLLGAQKNVDVIEQIADEIGGQIDKETFMKVYETAIHNEHPDQQNHNFLMIDFSPKDLKKMFRRNLDTYISTG